MKIITSEQQHNFRSDHAGRFLHEGKLLVDVEKRSFGEVFGRRHRRVVRQHLALQFGKGHQRLGDKTRVSKVHTSPFALQSSLDSGYPESASQLGVRQLGGQLQVLEADPLARPLVPGEEHGQLEGGHLQVILAHLVLKGYLKEQHFVQAQKK